MSSSKCPIDPRKIQEYLLKMNAMLELPWSPWYTQNADAEAADDALAYWALAATIAFTVLVYSLEGNLDARQKEAYTITTFPKELQKTVQKIDAERLDLKAPFFHSKIKTDLPLLAQDVAAFLKSSRYF